LATIEAGFISVEGPEGAGKSTVCDWLCGWLGELGIPTVRTFEPGGTALGERVRDIVLHDPTVQPNAWSEALLMCAARAQLVREVIRPALAAGNTVVCDRYADSTLAYQCHGRGLPEQAVRQVLDFATGGLWPAVTILLDLDPAVGMARKQVRTDAPDRIESEDGGFHTRVRSGYHELAAADPDRWIVVEASRPIEAVLEEIRRALSSHPAVANLLQPTLVSR
jgi:dTMP kinase